MDTSSFNMSCSKRTLEQLRFSVLGIHGTSVEAIISMLQRGKLVRESFSKVLHGLGELSPDYLYFTPNLADYGDYFSLLGINGDEFLNGNTDFKTWKNVLKESRFWGSNIGLRHYVLSALGYEGRFWAEEAREIIEDNDPNAENFLSYWDESYLDGVGEYSNFARFLNQKGITKECLWNIFTKASKRKGCLIAIDESVRELGVEGTTEEKNIEAKIYTPNGLDVKYVKAIVPLGNIERKIFSAYLKK